MIVAVDGHSSTGKSTVSKILAARLGYTYIDTGAMYRIVTLKAMREGLIRNGNVDDEKLKEVLPTIIFGFKYNEEKKRYESYMNGEYVETAIRGLEVSDNVSLIAALPYVRELLVEKQREMAKEGGVIMDGRDIGSVVFPHAEVKFFMTASPEVRAQRRYKELIRNILPEIREEQILCEPIGRNTAPAIAYAAYWLRKHDPEAQMIVTPADHWVVDEEGFRSIIGECLDFVTGHDALMTVGIRPTRPETGYGYIQASADETICPVKSFTEKPNLELAQTFVQCGEFFWNSGIFVWKVRDIVRAFAQYLPEHHALFSSVEAAFGTPQEDEAVERVFSCSHPISIDYGVMEKAGNVYVRSNADVGWSDVGTWGSLYQLSRKDRYANAKPAEGCYAYDTRNCIISLPEGKVAVVSGLKEYIVVDTEDVLMICPRGEEQNIKKYIDEVKFNKGEEYI